MKLSICLLVCVSFITLTYKSANAQLSPAKKAPSPDSTPTSDNKSIESKNKESAPRYETYYNTQGEKEVIAYKYGFDVKKDKKKTNTVQYEKTTSPSGETNTAAYKWGYQYKDSVPKIKMTTPNSLSFQAPPSAASGANTANTNEVEQDETPPSSPAAAATDSGGPNAELRNKVLEMIKNQKAQAQ